MSWRVGERVEHYHIREIKGGPGKSGMGIVYICYDYSRQEPVALKTLQERFFPNQNAIERFRREASIWVELGKHRNIVRCLRVEDIQGRPFIVMEYVAGEDLDAYIGTQALDFPLKLNFAIQVCNGIEYAYEKLRMVHRDIKPGNILVTKDNVVKVTDFGLAKAIEEKEWLAHAKTSRTDYKQSGVAGTFLWASPEQLKGTGLIDTRSDIFSFGIVLYQLIYDVKSVQLLDARRQGFPPREMIYPTSLRKVISRCLEVNRDRRYTNFTEPKKELTEIYKELTGESIAFEETPEEADVSEMNQKGMSLSAIGKREEALKCYNRALEINPKGMNVLHNKGLCLIELGRRKEGIKYIDKVIECAPRNARAWATKGKYFHDIKRHKEAIECCDKAININPKLESPWIIKGSAIMVLSVRKHAQMDEAMECFNKALYINPRNVRLWFMKGFALYVLYTDNRDSTTLREARECIQTFLDLAPSGGELAWEVKRARAFVYKYDHGLISGQSQDQTDRERFEGEKECIRKGLILDKLGRITEAIEYYDKALEINPKSKDALVNKGGSLANLNRLEEALECFSKALDIDPEDGAAWTNKGIANYQLGRNKDAVECLNRALRLEPKVTVSYYYKGLALKNLGKYEEAKRSLEEFVKHPVKRIADVNAVRKVISELGEKERNLQRTIEKAPRNAGEWVIKGRTLGRLGKNEEALRCFEKALELDPNLVKVYFYKGVALYKLERHKKAKESWQKFVECASPDEITNIELARKWMSKI